MTQPVPLAQPEAPPALRLVTLGVPLLLVALAFVPAPDWPGIHWVLLGLGLLLGLLFHLAPRRLTSTLTPEALVVGRLLGRTAHFLTPADPGAFLRALAARDVAGSP